MPLPVHSRPQKNKPTIKKLLPIFAGIAWLTGHAADTLPQTPNEEKTQMNNAKILHGIPVLRYGNPSAVCYIGSVMRLMEHINDPIEQDELFALSGVGLCFPWGFASDCDEVSLVPEIPARLFGALGYESELLTGDAVADKRTCHEKIKASIDAGRPVMGFGITTKAPYACLIVGYDADGLYTRSFWPPEDAGRDSEEYFYSTDWHENCAGLQFVGKKIEERLAGMRAYEHIISWAKNFRWERESHGYKQPIVSRGREMFLNERAFNKMVEWLLDDAQWENPNEGGREQFLKQCGLLLFGHYRHQLSEYLKKLDAKFPGIVHPPVLAALERIHKAIPGAHQSDLWLHEAVDPALKDFSNMRGRAMREKVADYARRLQGYDNSVQWTLFMPGNVKGQQKGFKVETFELRKLPAMRFVGKEGKEFADVEKRLEIMRALDALRGHRSGFDHDVLLMHHDGRDPFFGGDTEAPFHGIWGRFMKAGTPVPEGFVSYDFVPQDNGKAGLPFVSRFAFATFSGDVDAMHAHEGFDCDAMYDVTRNILLGDDVNIPYPKKYWTAEVFLDGCGKPGTGYLFSIGEWE